MLTAALPGLRDIYYGRISRGVALAVLFSFSLILLWAKGFLVKDWLSIDTHVPLWKIVVPSAAIAVTYALSIFARPSYEGLGYRGSGMRAWPKDHEPEESTAGAAVS
jgi:hypothetical protein